VRSARSGNMRLLPHPAGRETRAWPFDALSCLRGHPTRFGFRSKDGMRHQSSRINGYFTA
jgi:hypothetical protein